MLIRFVVNNFLSFGEEREFNMLAGKSIRTHKHHVYKTGKLELLKAAAIYGANGAGKSNLVKAIKFLQELVWEGEILESVSDDLFKLNSTAETKAAEFEIEFSALGKQYAYGVNIKDTEVISEWLYQTGGNKPEKLIFERKKNKGGKISIKVGEHHLKAAKSKLLIELMEENLLKPHELFLSKYDTVKFKELLDVNIWFHRDLIIIFPNSRFNLLAESLAKSENLKEFTDDFLRSMSTGVERLHIQTAELKEVFHDDEELIDKITRLLDEDEQPIQAENDPSIVFVRENGKDFAKSVSAVHLTSEGKEVAFMLPRESDGTRRLLDFIPAFEIILRRDTTFIIDEIDQSLHPALLNSLIRKIMAYPETKGQLIFTTHEISLLDLDIFRQDEIWFAEKDKKTGSTQLYSLSEFKPRYDLDIEKGYLKGRFGAIPFLGNLQALNWQASNAEE